MTNLRRALASAVMRCAAAALPGALAAQSLPNQAQLYQLSSTITGARALWVNPAGLARAVEASIGAFVTGGDSLDRVRARQYGAQVATRALAFGWQHDAFPDRRTGNTYVLGLALGDDALALGGTRRWYRGSGAKSGAWDVGLHARARAVDLAAVWRDIGSPTVRDSVLEETLVAGAALDLAGRARLAAEWQGPTSGFTTRRVRVGLLLMAGRGMTISAIQDISSNVRLRALTLAVQFGGPKGRVALFERNPTLRHSEHQIGASVESITAVPAPRRRGRI